MKFGKKLMAACIAVIAAISLNICTLPAYAAAKTTTTTAKTAAATQGTVTAKALNVRSGPGKTNKKIGTLRKGDLVTIVSTKSGWKKVHHKNLTGYVYAKYLKAK